MQKLTLKRLKILIRDNFDWQFLENAQLKNAEKRRKPFQQRLKTVMQQLEYPLPELVVRLIKGEVRVVRRNFRSKNKPEIKLMDYQLVVNHAEQIKPVPMKAEEKCVFASLRCALGIQRRF